MLSWKPILTPSWAIAIFIIFAVFYIPAGLFIYTAQDSVIEWELSSYENLCNMTTKIFEDGVDAGYGKECSISLNIIPPKRMEPPIYMYYKLTNVFQNHRLYRQSKSDYQIQGNYVSFSDASNCYPFIQNSLNQTDALNNSDIYNPCGLVPWSMFNDTYILTESSGTTICNGPNPDGVICDKSNITSASEKLFKFKNPAINSTASQQFRYPNQYFNENGHLLPQQNDTDCQVWATTENFFNFRKLYRIINVPLDNTRTYQLNITQRWPVLIFGGTKAVVFSTASWIGGRNLMLPICFFIVGGVSLIMILVIFVLSIFF